MLYALSGFIFGLLIPYMARRFAKFMPATAAYALYRLVWPVKRVAKAKREQSAQYKKLMDKYRMRSIGWGIICAALSYLAYLSFPAIAGWFMPLIWILLLLYEIDERILLLPDVLTVPLLILGFAFSSMALPDSGYNPVMSALGALAGYILPIIATLFLVKKHPDAFGGGDIKLLAAVGAWLGLAMVPYVILISCVVFALFSLAKRQRAGAFGPAIVIATLILVFFGRQFIMYL